MEEGHLFMMLQKKVAVYVTVIAGLALGQFALVYSLQPGVNTKYVTGLAFLGALAVIAETLGFFVSSSAKGSIAFIPYLASVLIAPSWAAVAVAAGIKLLVEVARRAEPIKAVFNVAQHGLATGLAVLVYTALGGPSLLDLTQSSFASASITAGLPAVAALSVSFLVNTSLVSGVIAMSSGRRVREVWGETHLASIGVDLLAAPVVFLFAWVCARYGPIAAAALWVPILGIRQLNKSNVELDRMNRELLQLMVKSIEARDPYTSGHSRRVQHFAVLIARAIGLGQKETRRIGQAALLHDVGKIYEKYAPILSKTDRLTPDEWATIQQHPVDGAELVSTMTQLHDIVPAIRHHHERWDGAGYPDGLGGEAIPLPARIIALADTIDAMTSVRPYRRALTPEDVREEIIRCRGSQFDPAIVDRLLVASAWRTIFSPPRESAIYGELQLVTTAK